MTSNEPDWYVPGATPAADRSRFTDEAIVVVNDLSYDASCQRGPAASDVTRSLAVTSAWQDGYPVELRMSNAAASTVPLWHARIDLKTSTFAQERAACARPLAELNEARHAESWRWVD